MLVLTRKLNERIVIGDNVRITVVGIRGNHIRIGIEAPPEVTILRDELRRFQAGETSKAGANAAEEDAHTPQGGALRARLAALTEGVSHV